MKRKADKTLNFNQPKKINNNGAGQPISNFYRNSAMISHNPFLQFQNHKYGSMNPLQNKPAQPMQFNHFIHLDDLISILIKVQSEANTINTSLRYKVLKVCGLGYRLEDVIIDFFEQVKKSIMFSTLKGFGHLLRLMRVVQDPNDVESIIQLIAGNRSSIEEIILDSSTIQFSYDQDFIRHIEFYLKYNAHDLTPFEQQLFEKIIKEPKVTLYNNQEYQQPGILAEQFNSGIRNIESLDSIRREHMAYLHLLRPMKAQNEKQQEIPTKVLDEPEEIKAGTEIPNTDSGFSDIHSEEINNTCNDTSPVMPSSPKEAETTLPKTPMTPDLPYEVDVPDLNTIFEPYEAKFFQDELKKPVDPKQMEELFQGYSF